MGSTKPSPDLSSPLGLASVSTELGADFSRAGIQSKLIYIEIQSNILTKAKHFQSFLGVSFHLGEMTERFDVKKEDLQTFT